MKRQIVVICSLIVVLVLLAGVTGCKNKNGTVIFSLTSLTTGAIDLNTATPPSNVPANPQILATFSAGVSIPTANNTTIRMTESYDTINIPLTITVAGSSITIVPTNGLGNGAFYTLSFKTGIMSVEGQLLPEYDKTFTTTGTFVPGGTVAYWNFNDTVKDQVGTFNPPDTGIVDLLYAASFNSAAGQAGVFNGTTTIVEIPNGDALENTHDFTLSFYVKAISAGQIDSAGNPRDQCVIGLGASFGFQFQISGDYSACKLSASYNVGDTSCISEDLWFAGDGNLDWQGWTYCRDLTGSGGVQALLKDKWAFITCVYNSTTKIGTLYINGDKMKSQDFNLWPAGDPRRYVVGLKYHGTAPEEANVLSFGFIKSRASTLWNNQSEWNYDNPYANHFGGLLDEVRIFHRALTANEISWMYNSLKPEK
ncbi:MAG: Ig-like domain-containing protein [Bacteroidetes bacterium]|nr:Ig-like domain-containing protein [Bacteroidota bacterium]